MLSMPSRKLPVIGVLSEEGLSFLSRVEPREPLVPFWDVGVFIYF